MDQTGGQSSTCRRQENQPNDLDSQMVIFFILLFPYLADFVGDLDTTCKLVPQTCFYELFLSECVMGNITL